MALEELYSLVAAAKKLGGVSVWTIRSWIAHGKIQATKVGSRTMVTESELEKFVRSSNRPKCAQGDDSVIPRTTRSKQ